ncbi:FA_FANCE domain-containing protein [Psidium guajava]|nr:FA_FANCE domain-containing protein [Psidium guajava]
MEPWTPLFDIFLNSPTPETDASRWLQESFSSSSTSATPVTTASFLSLLSKPFDAIDQGYPFPSSPSPSQTKRVMFIQTLPAMVQSRILSFLALEHQRFCARGLSSLARVILGGGEEVDFWVARAARHLLDVMPESDYEWISRLGLDSGGERIGDEFGSVPVWLKNEVAATSALLPWLPVSLDEFNSAESFPDGEENEELLSEARELDAEPMDEDVEDIEICYSLGVPLEPEIQDKAKGLRAQIANFESTSRTVALANAIREICLGKGLNSVGVLELIEPWKADDEAASVLISHLTDGSQGEFTWPSLVLCSVILPRLLVLEVPVTRVLLTATVEYCKLHQKATEYALLLPLIMRKEGLNNPVCEAISRIIKECLHPAHVTAFCHKLLCDGKNNEKLICLPSHQCLISPELVWTESLFNMFQNLLNHNIHLTQESVDCIINSVQKSSLRFSKSLKFGNFLLCLVTKCSSSLKSHKQSLAKAVECTNTLVTKSILSKLSNL